MTQNEQRVFHLIGKLPNLSYYAEGNKCKLKDEEWDAHHCGDFIVSCSIEDYQVLRYYDVEIDPQIDFDEFMKKLTPEQRERWDNSDGDEDDFYDWYLENTNDEDPFASYEVGEYMQRWINLRTGEIVVVGRVFEEDPHYCDLEGAWTIVSNSTNYKCNTFFNSFNGHWGNGFYVDHDVNPILQDRGYIGMDTTDWYICTGSEMEENRPAVAQFFLDNQWDTFLQTLAIGTNPFEQRAKTYGMRQLLISMEMSQENANKYLSAVKVARRHGYDVTQDEFPILISTLIDLNKDIRNPHYICPADIIQSIRDWQDLAHRRGVAITRALEREQRRVNEQIWERDKGNVEEIIKETSESNVNYVSNMSSFFDIEINGGGFEIVPLKSTKEFYDEGNSMNHCVFRMGYYRRYRSLILSVKDRFGERVATVEYDLDKHEIRQCYAQFDKIPLEDKKIRELITKNSYLISQRDYGKISKTA